MTGQHSAVPEFTVSTKELAGSFEDFIVARERKFRQAGICKIVPPKSWSPRRAGYPDSLDLTIARPIKQHASGKQGVYRTLLVEQKPLSLRDGFRLLAEAKENQPPATDCIEDLERHFWRNVTLNAPTYGADVDGTLFDKNCKGWNLAHLDSLLSRALNASIPGVNTPYLYFGMWRSMFCWHKEDMDLYSVNYLHYGKPKLWYCIPPEHSQRFEVMMKGLMPELFQDCPEFLRHKEILVSPAMLKANNIPYLKFVQKPREFVINYPGAYHCGFNLGYNCAESTNFATRSWIEHGAQADVCDCREDTVGIDMSIFLAYAPPRARSMILAAMQSDTSSESGSESGSDSGSEEASSSSDEEVAEEVVAPPRRKRAVASEDSRRPQPRTARAAGDAAGKGRARKRRRGVENEEPGAADKAACPSPDKARGSAKLHPVLPMGVKVSVKATRRSERHAPGTPVRLSERPVRSCRAHSPRHFASMRAAAACKS